MNDPVTIYYENAYREAGFDAQRRYPNEELLRFLGGHYFGLPPARRRATRILEVGCGSGANLWMIAREGFDAWGLDLSAEGLALAQRMLDSWGAAATLRQGSMLDMPFEPASFDAVVDVVASYCLPEREFRAFAVALARALKAGGRFFSYTLSKASDLFRDPAPGGFLDASTLDGVRRPTAPFFGNLYPVRFADPDDVRADMEAAGLAVTKLERVGRTYRDGAEYFEFLSYVAEKR